MDRTVPKTGGEEIELYMRTYYSLLRSTEIVEIETLEESHKAMESSLHADARSLSPDIAALTYSSLRLPPVMPDVDLILIGQLEESFARAGYSDVNQWERVNAPGRRRRVHYNGTNMLAVFIASRSDIDDIVPMLTAYQIEWNKMHILLRQSDFASELSSIGSADKLETEQVEHLAEILAVEVEDIQRLQLIWQDEFVRISRKIAVEPKAIGMQLLASSLADYRRATAFWWKELDEAAQDNGIDLVSRPVYFVSSNTHSLPNLLSGFAWRHEDRLIGYLREIGHEDLLNEYDAILAGKKATNRNNFLYYLLKKYLSDRDYTERLRLLADEQIAGIFRVPNRHGFQIAAQIIDISRLVSEWVDERILPAIHDSVIAHSQAVIINIDYPLGMAAYEILNRISERVGKLLGVYIMGKAATLNARVGDVMIPNVVHDEHSQNTYLFDNCFHARDVAPFMSYGMVLDNQKAISTLGTFLQNTRYMSVFYKEGYSDIEMEAGPYLSSIYEAYRPTRHPYNEIINLHGVPFDTGFLHYASDTPMGRGHNLGSSNLSYSGIDPTYATAIAILRRLFWKEAQRLQLDYGAKQFAPNTL